MLQIHIRQWRRNVCETNISWQDIEKKRPSSLLSIPYSSSHSYTCSFTSPARSCRCLQSDLPGKPWTLNNTADTDHVVVKVFHSAGSTHCWLNWGKNSLLIFNSGCCMNLTTFVCFFSVTSYFDFNSEFGININRIVTLYSLLSVYSKMKSI